MKSLITCFLLTSLLLLIGCQKVKYNNEASTRFRSRRNIEGAKPGLRVRDTNFPENQIKLNNAVHLDDNLRYKIAIEATNSQRTPTQTLEVWAQIRNRTDHSQQLECRVQWFDERKVQLEKPSAWQRIYLPGNSIVTYKETSSNIFDIKHYYIEIREGR